MRCRYNKELTCPILNEKLGDCEITENEKVVWRCHDYIEDKIKEEIKTNGNRNKS